MPFRENLLATLVTFFDYIPSKEEYSTISAEEYSENPLLLQASLILSESDIYQNSDWPKNATSNKDKVLIIIEKLLPNLLPSNALYKEAFHYLEALVDKHSLTESLSISIDTLLKSNSPLLAKDKAFLTKKIELSEYAATKGGTISLEQTKISKLLRTIESGDHEFEEIVQAVDQATQSWHFMVYMMADNNLEQYALNDLAELSDLAASDYASVSVAIDRSAGHDTSLGNWTDTRFGTIGADQTIAEVAGSLTSAGEVNMGNSESLTAFIDWSISQNPADHYALVLWDHGLGHDGIGVDEGNSNDSLSLTEINQGIADSSLSQLDQIIFDACSMAMIEVASALSSVTNRIVASQDLVPSEGINYTSLASHISNANGIGSSENLGALITQSYSDYFTGLSTMAFSILDTTKTFDFINAANAFADSVLNSSNSDWSKIQQARSGSEYYYDNQSIDLDSFLTALIQTSPNTSLTIASQNLLNASHEVVTGNTATKEQSEGVSIYWPNRDMGHYYQNQYEEVVEEIGLSSWGDFIDNYWDI